MLLSETSDSMALSASLAASGKFALITLTLAYICTGIIAVILNTIFGHPQKTLTHE